VKRTHSIQQTIIALGRLVRSGTELIIVVAMLEAMLPTRGRINRLCTWLLFVSASVASFVLCNTDKLVPILGKEGFLTCGVLLALSSLCGLLAKIFIARFELARAPMHKSLASGGLFARFQAVLFLAFLASGLVLAR
jgi:hypothetical protein